TDETYRHWSYWGMYHLIDYVDDEPIKVVTKPISSFYTVKKGDTLSKIAKVLKTTVDKLYSINKDIIGSNKNLIRVGQKLRIPG
ncbi:MAG TPA: LysM domain-containing protein, partial [Erysipelotrichaceae bacterium]|nr:LysM domain-containing protein [Erysipelotrichaceae bacterium]